MSLLNSFNFRCLKCNAEVTRIRGTTSTMRSHLKSKHPDIDTDALFSASAGKRKFDDVDLSPAGNRVGLNVAAASL